MRLDPARLGGPGAPLRRGPIAGRCRLLLLLLQLVCLWRPVCAQAAPEPAFDELVLEVHLGGHLLSDSLSAYTQDRHVLLPLGELARLLTLGITVRADQGQASGFMLQEAQSFGLNVANGVVSIAGSAQPYERRYVQVIGDDVYVAEHLLAAWLPVDLKLALSTLQLLVVPRVKLPLQERLEREAAAALAGRPTAAPADPGYPRWRTPAQAIGVPFIDTALSGEVRSGHGGTAARTGARLFFSGDLLGMDGQAYLGCGSDGGCADHRLTLERADPAGGLLGPLGARMVSLGDVVLPGVPQVLRGSAAGVGALVSNRSLEQPTSFDRQTLRGPLEAGWDVTLYYNDALVGYQTSRADGLYLFEDLPLAFGANEFRLVFNGPLGQSRVERRSFLLDQAVVNPGEWVYTLGAQRVSEGLWQVAQAELGLTRSLSVNLGFSAVPSQTRGAPHRYPQAGVRAYLPMAIVGLSWVGDGHGGSLGGAAIKTQVGRFSLDYTHLERSGGFESDWVMAGTTGPARRDQVALATLVTPPGWSALATAVDLVREQAVGGGAYLDASVRVSTLHKGTAVSNRLHVSQAADGRSVEGILQLARRVAGVGLTGQVFYRASGSVQALNLGLDRYLHQGARVSATLTRDMHTGGSSVAFGWNASLGPCTVGASAGWNSRREITMGVQLFMSFGRDPRTERWFADAQPLAGTHTVSARAFVDRNRNGVFDVGEEPVPNAAFIVNGGGHHANLTDARGVGWLDRLPAGRYADLALDPGSLEDPQWKPVPPGYRVQGRSGRVEQIDFPVVSTSEVEGSVCLQGKKGCRGVGKARIELVDDGGTVAAATQSASDGYYLLHQVMPGAYRLRIQPGQAAELGLSGELERRLVVPAEGDFISGQDFRVVRP